MDELATEELRSALVEEDDRDVVVDRQAAVLEVTSSCASAAHAQASIAVG